MDVFDELETHLQIWHCTFFDWWLFQVLQFKLNLNTNHWTPIDHNMLHL